MITKKFAFHTPGDVAALRVIQLRRVFSGVETELNKAMDVNSREYAIAVTKLEELAMWAIKGAVKYDSSSVAHLED